MEKPTKIAVIILNWNGKKYLEQFLPFLIQHSMSDDVRLVVADNASTDGSLEFVSHNFRDTIEIMTFDKNYGFAGGYNKAIESIEAEYLVLLNSDVEVTKNWINPVIAFMDMNTDVAACMPKIKSFHHRDYFEYAGAAGGFIDTLGYPFCRGRIFDTIEKDEGKYDDIRDIFWATGACMFIRSGLFIKAGGFDEDFFAHMEEIDLCWRLKNMGYRVAYIPHSQVYHVGGGTLPQGNPWKTYLNFRNSLFMLYKNLPRNKACWMVCRRLGMDIISALKFLSGFQFRDVMAVFKAHLSFFKHKRLMKDKRLGSCVNGLRHKEMYKRNIVWHYYLKGEKTYTNLTF